MTNFVNYVNLEVSFDLVIEICLDKEAIEITIAKLEDVADSFKPLKKSLNIADDNSRQQIYYGAPGTGKSHRIKEQLERLHWINTK